MRSQQNLPAWPLGCALAGLNLLLMINTFGILSIQLTMAGFPGWLTVGLPVTAMLAVPLIEAVAGRLLHRRNPYAGRTLVAGALFTVGLGIALTIIFNLLDIFVAGL